ncbi:MAG: penicillin-binding protein, partial [Spirochaetales bacterium]
MKRSLRRAVIILAPLVLLYGFLKFYPLPDIRKAAERPFSTLILDRKGRVLQVLPLENGLRREKAAFDEIPEEVRRIILASEDRRFYLHPGIDAAALLRSLLTGLRRGSMGSGASTITMQVSRIFSPGRPGLAGKIREMALALCLEARYTKNEILDLYLNSIP